MTDRKFASSHSGRASGSAEPGTGRVPAAIPPDLKQAGRRESRLFPPDSPGSVPLSVHTSAVQKLGLDDEAVLELMAVADLLSVFNKLMECLSVEADEKPWHG
jgi:hypothetical protein